MFSKGEIVLPFGLEKVPLKSFHHYKKAQVVDCKISNGCNPGDSFVGEIKRLIATTHNGNEVSSESYILKMQPADEACRKIYTTQIYAKNELAFYSKVVPGLNGFLQKSTKNSSNQLFLPKFIYGRVEGEKDDVLVFEDLSVQGFRMTDKIKGLDFHHCKLVMKAYAHFHAVSLAMQKHAPEKFENMTKCIRESFYLKEYRDTLRNFDRVCNAMYEIVEKRYPEKVNSLEKLKKLTTNLFDNMVEIIEATSTLKVICHGDCWVNNILFKYDRHGKPENLRIIDFQLSRLGTLALDLSYVLFTSCQKEVLDENWDVFLDTYVTEVNEALTAMGTENSLITRRQLDDEMRKFGRFGIASAMMLLPIIMTPEEEAPGWKSGVEKITNMYRKSYTRSTTRDWVTDMIEFAIERNIL